MKQRYISLMLSVVTLFLSAGVLFVYGQTYESPSEPFPNGLKHKPVDTKPFTPGDSYDGNQEKNAKLGLGVLDFSESIEPINIKLNGKIGNASDSSSLWFSNGALVVDSAGTMGGLALPFSGSDPVAYRAGSIYYNTGAKKVKLYTPDGWTDIGTGSGGGDSFWVANPSGGIVYTGGDVFISNGGWTLKSSDATTLSGSRLSCDVNHDIYDCNSASLPKTGTNGQIGFDEAREPHPTKPIYTSRFDIYEYDVSKNTSSLLTGKVYAEKIYAGDVFISSKAWHEETPFAYTTNGAYRTKRGTAMCPTGYYVVGIEAWDADDGGYCDECLTGMKVKCAKL